jgi:hypothetical protein
MLIKDHKGILTKFQSQLKQQQQLIKLVLSFVLLILVELLTITVYIFG